MTAEANVASFSPQEAWSLALELLPVALEPDTRCYRLSQVATWLKLDPTRLRANCRNGVIGHVHYGRRRVMTGRQIFKLMGRLADEGDLSHEELAKPLLVWRAGDVA
jgi:hypothetical protein